MDEQNQNVPNFEIKLWFYKLKKKIPKISQILHFRKSSNFPYWQTQKKNNQSSEIVEFQKLANF